MWGNSPHTDGIQVGSGATNLVIRHNSIDPVGSVNGGGATSAIIMYVGETARRTSNVWIEDNYIDGRDARPRHLRPRVSRRTTSTSTATRCTGRLRPYTACVRLGITVTEFNENRDAGTGALISPDNGVGGGCYELTGPGSFSPTGANARAISRSATLGST